MIKIIYALQAGCIGNHPFALREFFSRPKPSRIAVYNVVATRFHVILFRLHLLVSVLIRVTFLPVADGNFCSLLKRIS